MVTATLMGILMIMTTPMPESVRENDLSAAGLYLLLTFLSPSFPIGAFTYSHGLEQVIEDGDVGSSSDLIDWLSAILEHGSGLNDAILLHEAMLAIRANDQAALTDLIDLGLALQPARERHLETSAQGTAFIQTIKKAWQPEAETEAANILRELAEAIDCWPYPVAFGAAAGAWGIPANPAVSGYLHAFSANLVSAAIRAVPLGQTEGQQVLAKLEPVIFAVTAKAQSSGLDDLGSCCFLADIASMSHETQYTRLFRS